MGNEIRSRIVPTLAQSIFGIILATLKNGEITLDYDTTIDLTKYSTPCYFEKTMTNQRSPQFPYDEITMDNVANGKLISEGKIAFATANEYELEEILQQHGYKYIYNTADKRFSYIIDRNNNIEHAQSILSVNKLPSITGNKRLCFFTVKQNVDNDEEFSDESVDKDPNIEILFGVEFAANMSKIDADKPNFVFYNFIYQDAFNYADIKLKSKKITSLNTTVFREQVSYLKMTDIKNTLNETLIFVPNYGILTYSVDQNNTDNTNIIESSASTTGVASQENVNEEENSSTANESSSINIESETETIATSSTGETSEQETLAEQNLTNKSNETTNTPTATTTSSANTSSLSTTASLFTWPWGDIASIGESVYLDIKEKEKFIPKIVFNNLANDIIYCDIAGIDSIKITGYVIPFDKSQIVGIYADVYIEGENYHYDCPHLSYKLIGGTTLFEFDISHDDLVNSNLAIESKLFVNLYVVDSKKQVNNAIINIHNIDQIEYGFITEINSSMIDYGVYTISVQYHTVNAINAIKLLIDEMPSSVVPILTTIDVTSGIYQLSVNKLNLSNYSKNEFNVKFEVDETSGTHLSNSKTIYIISDNAPVINPTNNMNDIIIDNDFDIYFKYENFLTNGFNKLIISFNGYNKTLHFTDMLFNDNIYCIENVYTLLGVEPIPGNNTFQLFLYTNYDTIYTMNYTTKYVDISNVIINNANLTITNVDIGTIKVDVTLTLPDSLLDNYIKTAILSVRTLSYDVEYKFSVNMTVTTSGTIIASGSITLDTTKWIDDIYDFSIEIIDRYNITYINED